VRAGCPILCGENRERRVALTCVDSSPKPLSVALKWRERMRAVNRSVGARIFWLTGDERYDVDRGKVPRVR
jgi:hypothetical protein